jgi:DNA-binding CsgD family transcriptional regulator
VAIFRPDDEQAVARLLDPGRLDSAHHEGARLDTTSAVRYALRSRGSRTRPRSGWASLTPTEIEVVGLVALGLGNREIGARLLIAEGTVRTHLRSVFGKLGLHSRTGLAAEAVRRGH